MKHFFWGFDSLDDIVTAINGETRMPHTAEPTPGVGGPASELPLRDTHFSLEAGSLLAVETETPVILSLQGTSKTYDLISDPSPSPPVAISDL